MNDYTITNDPIELLSGTSNTTSPSYKSVLYNINEGNEESDKYMDKFLKSINKLAAKEKFDKRISDSKGNISSFSGYEDIKSAIHFLKNIIKSTGLVNNLESIFKSLESNSNIYSEAYNKKINIVILEYESSVYLLVTGLLYVLSNEVEIVEDKTGVRFKSKAGRSSLNVINKTIKDLSKILNSSKHTRYLQDLVKVTSDVMNEGYINESTVSQIFATIMELKKIFPATKAVGRAIINSMFGILPLIRSIMYLRYKRKADTILSLERQMHFINVNIEQLQNVKGMDPKKKADIIAKQRGYIEAYKKKAEKLRAELVETEKDAAVAIKEDEKKSDTPKPSTTQSTPGDDFVLD